MRFDKEELVRIGEYVLDGLRRAGADAAQCSIARGELDELNAENNEWSLYRSVFNNSVTMKALVGSRKGVAHVNSFEKDDIDAAVADCIAAAKVSADDEAVCIASLTDNVDDDSGLIEPDIGAFYDRIDEYVGYIKQNFPQINIEQLSASFSTGDGVMMNTNGVLHYTASSAYGVDVMYSAHDGKNVTSFNGTGFTTDSLDKPFISYGEGEEPYKRAVAELSAKAGCDKFRGVAVFCPSCAGEFVGGAIDLFASDSPLIDGTSLWKDSLGQKVASDVLTVSYAPGDPRVVRGEKVSDDGYPSRDYDVIKDGVLESFCMSEYGARRTGGERAPNSSGALRVSPGEKSLDEMISGIKLGILVGRFSGGAPAPNGDFSGVAKNSFMIREGRIAEAVTETMISGNCADMLKNVVGVSRELVCDGTTILPYIAFDGMTVS